MQVIALGEGVCWTAQTEQKIVAADCPSFRTRFYIKRLETPALRLSLAVTHRAAHPICWVFHALGDFRGDFLYSIGISARHPALTALFHPAGARHFSSAAAAHGRSPLADQTRPRSHPGHTISLRPCRRDFLSPKTPVLPYQGRHLLPSQFDDRFKDAFPEDLPVELYPAPARDRACILEADLEEVWNWAWQGRKFRSEIPSE